MVRCVWVLGLLCIACEGPPEVPATPVAPKAPEAPKVVEAPPKAPAAPRKPTLKPATVEPRRWVYPTSEMFDEGDVVSSQGVARLAEVRAHMKDGSVRIETHTNTRGSSAYNLKRSQVRADALRGVLSEESAALGARIEAIGFGEAKPPAEGEASRVEIVLFKSTARGE